MISFVCGQLCSGKTLYSEALRFASPNKKLICVEVGDIVRGLKKSIDRKVLQNSKELSKYIIDTLKLEQQRFGEIVVSGVRQKEILEAFPEATLLWIECPKEVRKQRYLARQREGDNQTFEEAEQGDKDLGILEVKQYIYTQNEYIS
jgi:dephospho-CoA kinase